MLVIKELKKFVNNKLSYVLFVPILIFFSLRVYSSVENSTAATIWEKPNFPYCTFYRSVDNDLKCSKQGNNYLIDYGEFYCKKFSEKLDVWDGDLKTWAQKTGQCLQEMIYDNRAKRFDSCQSLEDFAFDSHPICYKQNGICKLSYSQIFEIFKVVEIIHVLKYKTNSWSQFENVFLECTSFVISKNEKRVMNNLFGLLSQNSNAVNSNMNKTKTMIDTQNIIVKIVSLSPTSQRERESFFKDAAQALFVKEKELDTIDEVNNSDSRVSSKQLQADYVHLEEVFKTLQMKY